MSHKVNFQDEIATMLAKKYGISEQSSKKHVKYIVKRVRELMEMPDTVEVKIGRLGKLFVSRPVLKMMTKFKKGDPELIKAKFDSLENMLRTHDKVGQKDRVRLTRFPRIINKSFNRGRNLEALELHQNLNL